MSWLRFIFKLSALSGKNAKMQSFRKMAKSLLLDVDSDKSNTILKSKKALLRSKIINLSSIHLNDVDDISVYFKAD